MPRFPVSHSHPNTTNKYGSIGKRFLILDFRRDALFRRRAFEDPGRFAILLARSYRLHFGLRTLLHLCNVQCGMCNVQCAMCNVQCAMCNVQCARRGLDLINRNPVISRLRVQYLQIEVFEGSNLPMARRADSSPLPQMQRETFERRPFLESLTSAGLLVIRLCLIWAPYGR